MNLLPLPLEKSSRKKPHQNIIRQRPNQDAAAQPPQDAANCATNNDKAAHQSDQDFDVFGHGGGLD